MKKVSIGILGIFILLSISGYLYLKKAFQSPPNTCSIENISGKIPIYWEKNEFSQRNGMYLPVTFKGIPDTLWMQFDLGAIYTVLYGNTLDGLKEKYGIEKDFGSKQVSFQIGEMTASFKQIKVIDFGEKLGPDDSQKKIIIGTIGTDILEKTGVYIDFQNSELEFLDQKPIQLQNYQPIDFEFKERRILIPVKINQEDKQVMWDTGASGFDLITSKDKFQELKIPGSSVKEHKANQLKRPLSIYTAPSHSELIIGSIPIPITQVSYVEGFPWYVHLMFRISGIEGMIGNNLFAKNQLYLDCQKEELILIPNSSIN